VCIAQCPVPSAANSGLSADATLTPPLTSLSNSGSTARATCNVGFVLQGTNDELTCNNGVWGGSIVCIAQCPQPTDSNSGLSPFASAPTQRFTSQGGRYTVTRCQNGYALVGGAATSLTCGAEGRWEGTIVCVPIIRFSVGTASAFEAPRVVGAVTAVSWRAQSGNPSWATTQNQAAGASEPVWPPLPSQLPSMVAGGTATFVVDSGGNVLFQAEITVRASGTMVSFNPPLVAASVGPNSVNQGANFGGSFRMNGGSGFFSWATFDDSDAIDFTLNEVDSSWGARQTYGFSGTNSLQGGAEVEVTVTATDMVLGTQTAFTMRFDSVDRVLPTINGLTAASNSATALDGVFRFNATERGQISQVVNAVGVQAAAVHRRCRIVDTTSNGARFRRLDQGTVRRVRRQSNPGGGNITAECLSASPWLEEFSDSCRGFFLTPPGVSAANSHLCDEDCTDVLDRAHPNYTASVDTCIEFLYITSANGSTIPGHSIIRNISTSPAYGFTAATIVQALFAYGDTCKRPIERLPGGLDIVSNNSECVISGTLRDNDPWVPKLLEPTDFPNEYAVTVLLEASTSALFLPSSTTAVNATILYRVFSPVNIVYQGLNMEAGEARANVNNDDSFSAFFTIEGGQTPYTIVPNNELPCNMSFSTTFQLSSSLTCPQFIETPARASGREAFTLQMGELFVRDGNDVVSLAPDIAIRRGPDDCGDAANGPNEQFCDQNAPCVDRDAFDGSFSCNCSGLSSFTGENCFAVTGSTSGGTSDGVVAGSVVSVLVVLAAAMVGAMYLVKKQRERLQPHDFEAHLQELIRKGMLKVVKEADGTERATKIPRELPRDDVIALDVLGSGEFGAVYLALWRPSALRAESGESTYVTAADKDTFDKVAVKTLKSEGDGELTRDEYKTMMAEATITAQFEHDNIVRLIGVVTVGSPLMIVLELCNGGELKKFVRRYNLSADIKTRLMHGIAQGMAHLSHLGYVHRDLAARNVLVSESESGLVPKVADFGLAKDTEQSDYYQAKAPGKIPIRWTAPEALEQRRFTTFSDVWAFGITCFELWNNGAKPMKGWTNGEVVERVVDEHFMMGFDAFELSGCDKELFSLCIQCCWAYEPEHRPTFGLLVKRLDFFVGLRKDFPEDDEDDANEALAIRALGIPPAASQLSDLPKSDVDRTVEERSRLAYFFGRLSESETVTVLRTQIGTTSLADTDTTVRKVYLLREINELTVVLSCMANGIIGHHVIDLTLSDKSVQWKERLRSEEPDVHTDEVLSTGTVAAVERLLVKYNIGDGEALVCNQGVAHHATSPTTYVGGFGADNNLNVAASAAAPDHEKTQVNEYGVGVRGCATSENDDSDGGYEESDRKREAAKEDQVSATDDDSDGGYEETHRRRTSTKENHAFASGAEPGMVDSDGVMRRRSGTIILYDDSSPEPSLGISLDLRERKPTKRLSTSSAGKAGSPAPRTDHVASAARPSESGSLDSGERKPAKQRSSGATGKPSPAPRADRVGSAMRRSESGTYVNVVAQMRQALNADAGAATAKPTPPTPAPRDSHQRDPDASPPPLPPKLKDLKLMKPAAQQSEKTGSDDESDL